MRVGLREGWCWTVACSVLCGSALSVSMPSAHAQTKPAAPSLSGTWHAGATAVDVAVESWGTDCGLRPESSHSPGGGAVTVVQAGKQLTVRSRDSEVHSDECWGNNPSMRRVSSSLVDQVWITHCKTPPNDPHAEQGTYVLKVMGPDTLLYQDVSHYNWALNTSKCVATFTTTQTLSRAVDAKVATPPVAGKPPALAARATATAPTPAVAAPAPAPAPPEQTCRPGAAAHLTLRPKHAEIQVGQRVCFHARVTDAAECLLPDAPLEWSLTHSRALRGELSNGCFTAASTTAEAEGEFQVLANSSGLRAEATVTVHSVDLSALIAQRIEGAGLTGLDGTGETAIVPAAPRAAAHIVTRSVAEPAKSSNSAWIVAVGALTVLAGLGAWLLRRKPAPSLPDEPTAEPAKVIRSSAPASPSAAAPSQRPAAAGPTSLTAPGTDDMWICPLCRMGYPARQGVCPRDGSQLMPYAEFSKRSRETSQERQKRCPKCGALCAATAVFCGDDGASLVDA